MCIYCKAVFNPLQKALLVGCSLSLPCSCDLCTDNKVESNLKTIMNFAVVHSRPVIYSPMMASLRSSVMMLISSMSTKYRWSSTGGVTTCLST